VNSCKYIHEATTKLILIFGVTTLQLCCKIKSQEKGDGFVEARVYSCAVLSGILSKHLICVQVFRLSYCQIFHPIDHHKVR